MPPYWDVDSPPPWELLRFRGQVRMLGMTGLLIGYWFTFLLKYSTRLPIWFVFAHRPVERPQMLSCALCRAIPHSTGRILRRFHEGPSGGLKKEVKAACDLYDFVPTLSYLFWKIGSVYARKIE